MNFAEVQSTSRQSLGRLGPVPSVLGRLGERKLVQWALAYLAAAWVVAQLVDVLGARWAWPLGVQRAVDVMLVVGLLITLVVAWYHGERGRQRVSGPELILIAGVLAVGGALVSLLGRTGERAADPAASWARGDDDRPTIAALPFENRSGLREDLYFTDGFHDQVLTQLSRLGAFHVVSRTSVMPYRASPKNSRTIGQELGARYLVEGGVQRAGDRVLINLQLIDAEDDENLWAESYEQELTVENLFDIQRQLAEQVALRLDVAIAPEDLERVGTPPTRDPVAYDLYLQGRFYWNQRTVPAMQQAERLFRAALEADSTLALAWAGLADIYVLSYLAPVPESLTMAKDAARRALDLDPGLAQAYTALAFATMQYDWDWEASERLFLRAMELSPDYATAPQWYAELLATQRRFDEAINVARWAENLDPSSMIIGWNVGRILAFAGRNDEALEQWEAVRQLYPDEPRVLSELIVHYIQAGRTERASDLIRHMVRLMAPPVATAGEINQRTDEIIAGVRQDGLRFLLPALVSPGTGGPGRAPAMARATAYAVTGNADSALAILEALYEDRAFGLSLPDIALGFEFDPIRSDPRFQDLVRRIGFPSD